MQKLKALKNKVGKYEGLVTTYEDILTLIEMGIEEQDDSVYEEVKEMNDSFLAEYEALRIATMLDGEYDRNNAIVTLHAGTGGTEACDWTNMLFRMYSRWAQKEGFEVEVLDMLDGDEAGLKSVVVTNGGLVRKYADELLPHVDALNIDLKGFSNEFYRYVKGEFDTVKEFIKAAVEHKCHVELTTLVIPTKNDDPEEIGREVEWIASISPEIPLHLSRFFPRYKVDDLPPTPAETIYRLKDIAEKKLKYVYTGNL